jgi:hypothetical protein
VKIVSINPQIFQQLQTDQFWLDLQKAQLPGHSPFPFWTKKYALTQNQKLAVPDCIFKCLTTDESSDHGAQYNLKYLFEQSENSPKAERLSDFPNKGLLQNKKVLIILAHNTFDLSDLVLAMPFIKIFSEATGAIVSVCVNSAGIKLFTKQPWLDKALPELMSNEDFENFDYYLEPSVDKMDTLAWIRAYLLKEYGEKVFHERFPAPKIVINHEENLEFNNHFASLALKQLGKELTIEEMKGKLCFLNCLVDFSCQSMKLLALWTLLF